MNNIILQKIKVNENIVEYYFSFSENLKRFFKTNVFFIQYEQSVKKVPISILTIPFVNCMAGLSWLTQAMLLVDEIDDTYYNAFKQLKRAYSELHESHLKGIFIPSKIVKNEIQESDDYLLLFGGGIDCHCSFLRHTDKVKSIVNIYGWLNSLQEKNDVDISDKNKTEAFANQFNIKPCHVRSNFASQFNLKEIDSSFSRKLNTSYWYGFLHPMAFLSIATPLAWINGISNLMIASSFTKSHIDLHCGSFITTDSEFAFGRNGKTLHDGFELNRQDKVKVIVDYQKTTNKPYFIQACSFNDHNCCECEKCFRTIVELVAENANPRDFGFQIDGSLTSHWKAILNRDIALWGVYKEKGYLDSTRERMKENYENIQDKEFVDWFLNFDFEKAEKEGLRRYYRKNFFSILKRKLLLS